VSRIPSATWRRIVESVRSKFVQRTVEISSPAAIAEEHGREKLADRAFELQWIEIEVTKCCFQATLESFGHRRPRGADANDLGAYIDKAPDPFGLHHRLRQQLVADLCLEAPLLPAARLFTHALPVVGDSHLELFIDRSGRQYA
jgi:hypothetical protein